MEEGKGFQNWDKNPNKKKVREINEGKKEKKQESMKNMKNKHTFFIMVVWELKSVQLKPNKML